MEMAAKTLLLGTWLGATALSALWAAPQPQGRLSEHPDVAAALEVLDAWIETTRVQREQPGLSVGILHDQDLIWARGYGFADLERQLPATPATLYRIASISKLFTSTAILQLRDAGRLSLSDPVAKHLPWFRLDSSPGYWPGVTIWHLLTHTSGLPREARGVNWSDLTYPTREEMIRRLPGQQFVFPPETEWKYSNLALSLAGEIVEAVSGRPWDRYLEEEILAPLGMTATHVLPRPDTPGLAVGYGRRVPGRARTGEPFVDIEAERPAGNLASNVEDLARFIALQLRDPSRPGPSILKTSTLREMHRVHWLHPDWSGGWGLGFAVRRVGEQVRVGHGGSLPGYRTHIEFSPADKLGVVVLTNADDGNPGLYLDKIFSLVGPALARATAPPADPPAPDPEWEKYVGTYHWKHTEVRVLILKGELTLILPESDNPWETRIKLEPVAPHLFRAVPARWSYAFNGDLFRFEVDADGRVTRVGTENFYWLRK